MVVGFKVSLLAWLFPVLVLTACATAPVAPEMAYSKASREHLYRLNQWSFEGRLSLTGRNDSWSASIAWAHIPAKEQIKLSGPLGQGATVIQLTGDVVSIDRGNGDVQTSDQPEVFVNQQLGMFVPVQSLRYWVVGLPEPQQTYEETSTGFKQAGWVIDYRQMQVADNQNMPRKIIVMNDQVKLKLFIDQWVLNSAR